VIFHTSQKEVIFLVASNFLPEDCFVGAVTVGERGQVVIPAEARKKLNISTGDKLLVMTHPSNEGLIMFKAAAIRQFMSQLAASLSLIEERETEPEQTPVPVGEHPDKELVSNSED
jgi:AbrB family looped-hinge helix DNA binding protein